MEASTGLAERETGGRGAAALILLFARLDPYLWNSRLASSSTYKKAYFLAIESRSSLIFSLPYISKT